jgi:proteasome lid subunit RPN8/RPN11
MRISPDALEAIRAHGAEGYPEEICGVMIGTRGDKTVTEAKRAKNIVGQRDSQWPDLGKERKRDRYTIDPRDHIRIAREADAAGLDIVGYYHSHPDHPAQASRTDAEMASADYVYLIVSVHEGKPVDQNAFVAEKDGGPFHPEPVEVSKPV